MALEIQEFNENNRQEWDDFVNYHPEGRFSQLRFHGSLHVSFKLVVDCLLVFNMFVRARKRQNS